MKKAIYYYNFNLTKYLYDNKTIRTGPKYCHDSSIWYFFIKGLNENNSPFEGFWFEGELQFKPDFPTNAPSLNFITPITHPKVKLNESIPELGKVDQRSGRSIEAEK